MRQYAYGRDRSMRGSDFPEYRDPDDIPLERDLRRRYRRPPSTYYEEQGYDTPLLGVLAAVLGAGALLAWYGTRSGAHDRRNWSDRQMSSRRPVAMDETEDLIASNKAAVYDRNGEKIGAVHNFMVGKRSGRVAYVVIGFGGFMGFGGGYHPLPWNALTYDEDQGGYVVNIDKDRLKNAPRHEGSEDPFANPAYRRQVTSYWLVLQ
jgi:hypothetical protein